MAQVWINSFFGERFQDQEEESHEGKKKGQGDLCEQGNDIMEETAKNLDWGESRHDYSLSLEYAGHFQVDFQISVGITVIHIFPWKKWMSSRSFKDKMNVCSRVLCQFSHNFHYNRSPNLVQKFQSRYRRSTLSRDTVAPSELSRSPPITRTTATIPLSFFLLFSPLLIHHLEEKASPPSSSLFQLHYV